MLEKFLELPEIKPLTVITKTTMVNRPDISMLTEEQLNIFNVITNLSLKNFSQTLLTGYGGTGKTFLTTKIIEEIIAKRAGVKIAITAPTNKAVRVLKNLSSICETHPRVDFNTLHSLLKLKRVITDDGKEEFKSEIFDDMDEYDLIIVDEVSMLDNSLYAKLLDKAKRYNIAVLFIGDRGQIPPVNGGESILFKMNLENNFNLTKIIRQSNGNPIIDLAQKIRNNKPYVNENIINEQNNGVMYLKIYTEMPLLERFFKSDNFEKDPNFVKVLGYTNKCVDYYNDKIREIIYGNNCGKLCVGEKMVCNKPILDNKNRVLLNNNDEFEVLSFTLKRETTGYKFYYHLLEILSNDKKYTIKLLADESKDIYSQALAKLKLAAQESYSAYKKAAWVKYFRLLDKYADVKYNYALTVHKSQGSTFENAIVIKCDINRVFNTNERNKLLYTAVTRAKSKLFII